MLPQRRVLWASLASRASFVGFVGFVVVSGFVEKIAGLRATFFSQKYDLPDREGQLG